MGGVDEVTEGKWQSLIGAPIFTAPRVVCNPITIAPLFPPSWKGWFDLINIRLLSHSEKTHYAAKEAGLMTCWDQGQKKWATEKRKKK